MPTVARVEVPEGCALSLYELGRVEDEVVVKAECACGQWEQEFTTEKGDQETSARAAWLTDHLVPAQKPKKDKDKKPEKDEE